MTTRTKVTEHERTRRAHGLGVGDLAAEVTVSHAYVSQIEGGQIPASPAYRRRVGALLGVPEKVLFDERGYAR